MKKTLMLAMIAVMSLSMFGCAKSVPPQPSSNTSTENPKEAKEATKEEGKEIIKIGIRGEIKEITTHKTTNLITLNIEGKKEEDTNYDKAVVGISKDTIITEGELKNKLSGSDLQVGMKVEVTFSGSLLMSYPVQGRAETIRIIK